MACSVACRTVGGNCCTGLSRTLPMLPARGNELALEQATLLCKPWGKLLIPFVGIFCRPKLNLAHNSSTHCRLQQKLLNCLGPSCVVTCGVIHKLVEGSLKLLRIGKGGPCLGSPRIIPKLLSLHPSVKGM